MHYEFAIIGAGINGLMTALELSRISDRIVIMDAAAAGRACSWAGGGILSPLFPWDETPANYTLCRFAQSLYPDLCELLAEETGIDPEYRQSGMLILDCKALEQRLQWCHSRNITAERIDHPDQSRFPGINFLPEQSSIWLPGVAHVRNPRLIRALKTCIQKKGIDLLEQCSVRELAFRTDHIQCRSDSVNLNAGQVILCTGAWLNQLLPGGSEITVTPTRGQMLCLQDHDLELQQIILKDGCYVIPRLGRVLLIGSTLEDVGFDPGITSQARELLLNAAREFVPGLNGCKDIKQWSGLRPDSGRGYPYIGNVPGVDKLFVNAGHNRTGLLTAPASARLLSGLFTKIDSDLDIMDYQPG